MDCKGIAAGIALLVAAEHALAATAAPKTWEYSGRGAWGLVPQSQPATQKANSSDRTPNDVLDRADRLLAQGRPEAARSLLSPWVKNHRRAPDLDRALFLLGESHFRSGLWLRAFYQFDELLDTFPESNYYYSALEKQFLIADGYLRGRKDRLLLMPILGREDQAVEMLFRIQERSPGSPLAERALLRTADYYYDAAQYDLAGDAYAAYLRSYGRSPAAPRARLRQAFSSLAQFRGLDFDATPLVDARAQLEDVIATYPDLAEEENLQAVIERIDAALAGKMFRTANFYERTHQPQAAAHMYRSIAARYPDSPDAERANQMLARLPANTRNAPVSNVAGGVDREHNTVPGPDVQ